ncbi:mucin-like protein 1 [Coprinopsis marcescibilis]|uniref:Mucin-like protein 1 n=1 Tax=Coprinopsis marcescibilis TaxID=230819 RepID=A0A5C3KHD4_COPMA|nr:mucin-like protein 1 [Coprinopsis marcescibilis]
MDADHRPDVECNNAEHSNCDQEVDDPDEIVGTVKLVTEILDGVIREMDWHSFETAVCVLNEAMGEETDLNIRASIRGALMKAFLTRFACYGWADDHTTFNKLFIDDSEEGSLTVLQCLSGIRADTPDVVQFALGLIDNVRKSIDGTVVDTAICVASELLESGACHGNPRYRLQIVLGRALVINYIQGGSTQNLEQGYRMVRDADVPHGANDPWAYIRAVSLENIGWTKCVEQGMAEVITEVERWNELAVEEDRQGGQQFEVGTELLKGGEFDEAITFLTRSLSSRRNHHPNRSSSLNNLATALATRFEHKGHFDDLDQCMILHTEALGLMPSPHPNRSASLNNLANALSTRFEQKGSLDDLDQSIILHMEALGLRPSPHPNRSDSLNNLATALATRFEHKGHFDDLDQCMILHTEALGLMPSPHPNRSLSLNNLANALSTRFEQKGSFDDLDQCIILHTEVLGLRPSPHPNRSLSLNNLASALSTRFEHKGSFDDLDQSIILHTEALGLMPSPHPNRSLSLNNLANALSTRFKHKGNFDDLDQSIILHMEMLGLRPSPHPNRSLSLNNLASALFTRFEHKGSFDDLDQSIILHMEALGLMPSPHPNRSLSLNNLAGALSTRFEHKGSFDDLDQCIILHTEALGLRPSPHPNRSDSLNNLASALSTRFKHKGSFDDLDQCIILHTEALGLMPPPHPNRSLSLNNLANALSTRFKHKGSFDDLDQSIILHTEVLGLRPSPHPNRSLSLNNLANALSTRFEHKGSFDDLDQCIILHTEALGLMPSPHPNRSHSLNNLASALSTRFKHKGSFNDLDQCIVLHTEALGLRPSPHPNRSLSLNNLANALFTRFEHKASLDDLDQSIILHTEVLGLRPSPHPNRSGSLNNLANALSTRFEQRGHPIDLAECIAHCTEALELEPSPQPTRSTTLFNLAQAKYLTYLLSHDGKDLDEALDLFKAAAEYATASLLTRLDSAKRWAVLCRENHRESALDAYSYTITLLPLLSSLDLTLPQRQGALVHTKDISSTAAQWAISVDALQTAVIFLYTSRSVFWSQALQLRSPLDRLDSVNKSLAQDLRFVSQRLEHATNQTSTSEPISNPEPNQSETLYSLSQHRERLLAKAREIDGFQDFLLPPSFDSLSAAARNGPVVLLNASEYGCDAIIMQQGGQLNHVSLVGVTLAMLQKLSTASQELAQKKSIRAELTRDIAEHLKHGSCTDSPLRRAQPHAAGTKTVDDGFRFLLGKLWTLVVKPVVDCLGLSKTETPPRLWWCATGVFSFLPIHAAGLYSKVYEPEDTLFQYVVSSYIYTPQDLISPPPAMTSQFKMVAVIEPLGGDGYEGLSKTKVELEKIRTRLPAGNDLIEHVGKGKTTDPINLDNILSNLQECSFAHFGCHGTQHPSNPLESALLLSGGRLTMEKVIQKCQASNGSLAYLSACQTAKSDEELPDEALTLAATMLFAGFRGVVGTMWSIRDRVAPVVADAFYEHMFRHGTECPPDVTEAAYALHLAVQKVRDSGEEFWNWVPYVHFGV